MGYIYLIENLETFVYKIGYTKNNNSNRLKQLQTGNHSKLDIVYMIETKHKRKVETTLHTLFKHKQLNGEWFELDNEDVLTFKDKVSRLEENFDLLKENNYYYK